VGLLADILDLVGLLTIRMVMLINSHERGFPQHPQPKTRTSLTGAYLAYTWIVVPVLVGSLYPARAAYLRMRLRL
jgi:hypothetical protein